MNKYLDLVTELEKDGEHEDNSDTNDNSSTWNSVQERGKD